MDKKFLIAADDLQLLVMGKGACVASDHIPVGGKKVGFMYREEPVNDIDNGWRFFSGEEEQEYVDNADNFAFYDVNTIANYDRDIIPLLDKPIGSAFEREGNSFVACEVD